MAKDISIEFYQDELEQLLEILYGTTDEGPGLEGWKSDKLKSFIRKLEEAAGVPEKDRW